MRIATENALERTNPKAVSLSLSRPQEGLSDLFIYRRSRDSPSRVLERVKTAIYEASDTKNVSLTHEKYRYDTAIKHRYKTIFFWCYNTYGMPQF